MLDRSTVDTGDAGGTEGEALRSVGTEMSMEIRY